jgi:hypothetical protein
MNGFILKERSTRQASRERLTNQLHGKEQP